METSETTLGHDKHFVWEKGGKAAKLLLMALSYCSTFY
jgi:hypothetical protein